jgi:hypothetical protein
VGLLFLVYRFSLTYVLKLFGAAEVFFVNQIGLPFNSGSIITGIALAALIVYAIRKSKQMKWQKFHVVAHMVLFFIIGFSTWLMLPIRANAQTVVNENNPEDARALLAYYNREQYPAPESPFYGSFYSDYFAPAGPDQDGTPKYEKNQKLQRYEIVNAYKGAFKGQIRIILGFCHACGVPHLQKITCATTAVSIFQSIRATKEIANCAQQLLNSDK